MMMGHFEGLFVGQIGLFVGQTGIMVGQIGLLECATVGL